MNFENFAAKLSALLWSESPSEDWAESYPLGNGRIGAMVQGQPATEMISFNHDLLWRSYLQHPTYRTHKDMPRIKQLCAEKKWREAEELLTQTIPQTGECIYINPFVPVCDLYLNMLRQGEVTDYKRSLDMQHGITYVQYRSGDAIITRTAFCSEELDVFILHIKTTRLGTLCGEVSLSRILERECIVTGGASHREVWLEGEFEEGKQFAAAARVIAVNGRCTSGKRVYTPSDRTNDRKLGLGYVFDRDESVDSTRGASVCFDSCDEVVIAIAIAVDSESDCPLAYCRKKLDSYDGCDYEQVRDIHATLFASYYNRTQLLLTAPSDMESTALSPTVVEQLFNMARYVAIASGMPQKTEAHPKAPINLQGLWNRDTRPAWESDYHTDLNLEMCYWPLAAAGLTEWYEPYLAWMERLMPQARQTAREMYGCDGAAIIGCCDPFVMGRIDNVGATWLGSSAWLCQILWIYYEHAPQTDILMRIYALMQEFAVFYEEMFITDDKGRLTFPFGVSPEMPLIIDGKMQWTSSATTIDLTLAKEFFGNLAQAAERCGELGKAAHYADVAAHIQPPTVDENGCLQEWNEQHEEGDPGHRHRSPIVTFCPGSLYSMESDPAMSDAIERLLERRLSAGTGMATSFSYSWDAHILARLRRGNDAMHLLKTLVRIHMMENGMFTTNDYTGEKGGITWFSGIKVMQVDAQLGLISAISEMLYQDMQGIIRLLPALPDSLPEGSLCGIRGRFGFVGDLTWKDGRLLEYRMTSMLGGICQVRYNGQPLHITCDDQPIACESDDQGIYTFNTVAGKVYTIA